MEMVTAFHQSHLDSSVKTSFPFSHGRYILCIVTTDVQSIMTSFLFSGLWCYIPISVIIMESWACLIHTANVVCTRWL